MRRKILTWTAAAACAAPVLAGGGGPWIDNFESYAPNVQIAPFGGWEGWDDNAAWDDSVASTAQAHSGSQSVAITGADDLTQQFDGVTSGVWDLKCQLYVPGDMSGETFYILLNQYAHNGPYNWSTEVVANVNLGTIRDFDDGSASLPLITDAWVELKVVINLDDDQQAIFYNGALLNAKSWSEGASGGGSLTLECIDLFANEASVVYYDTFSLRPGDPDGACCFDDGSCTIQPNGVTCVDTEGGDWQGSSTLCIGQCPELGLNGWLVEAPLFWQGDTCEEIDTCSIGSIGEFANDIQYEITIPWEAPWTFSVCGADWNTVLYLGSSPCTDDLGLNDDFCAQASELTVNLTPGTYYLTLDANTEGNCGTFNLSVSGPCIVADDPLATPEGEPVCTDEYDDTHNGGCNSDPAVFTSISCGEAIMSEAGNFQRTALVDCPGDLDGGGTVGFTDLTLLLADWGCSGASCVGDIDASGGTGFTDLTQLLSLWGACPTDTELVDSRDTDWYLFMLTETTEISYKGFAEFPLQMLLIDGNMTCDDTPIIDARTPGPCELGDLTWTLEPGTYYLWGGPQAFDLGVPCGSPYRIQLDCTTP